MFSCLFLSLRPKLTGGTGPIPDCGWEHLPLVAERDVLQRETRRRAPANAGLAATFHRATVGRGRDACPGKNNKLLCDRPEPSVLTVWKPPADHGAATG